MSLLCFGRRLVCAAIVVTAVASAYCGLAGAESGPDPLASEQGYRQTIALPLRLPRLAPVNIGVVDSGVDGENPDLSGRIVAARGFGGLDPVFPDSPHGTMVAGLIAATPGNGLGIDGVSPTARLIVASVSRRGSAEYSAADVAAAIRWTVAKGARVVNLSLAGPSDDPALATAIRYAHRHDVLVVAAAGNCFPDCGASAPVQFPAADPHVLAVGAVADTAPTSVAVFSDRRAVDVVAPGVGLTTLFPTRNSPYVLPAACAFVGTTACWRTGGGALWGATGTSFAAALVTGAASLLFAARPQLHADQVAYALERTAVRAGSGGGFGLVQVAAALRLALDRSGTGSRR